ncbi:DUF1932 domain-containing protein [Chelativorans sp.]|uniref:NAD(P)-dependent oxidoreductase n=1 Tax=Chelativorans sp. TaxID=2203393 RepID=UPI002811D806|nr:DUF1932 domain-containing protein [Chelativorans sp.]
MHIAFIGFGEAARAFAGTLREKDSTLTFSAYDILLGTEKEAGILAAAEQAGVRMEPTVAEAVAAADWVIAAVTAASSLAAAKSVDQALRPGQVYIDINSVSAGVKRQTAALLAPRGAVYVDMAVMSPVHPRGHRSPVLVAGEFDRDLLDLFAKLGFDLEFVGAETGMAATIKMVRSLFVKGLEAITVQAMVAAHRAGCLDRVFASLAKSFPQFEWERFVGYQFERVATHGVRRAAEMRESALAMRELGLPEGEALAAAIAELQSAVGERQLPIRAGKEPAELAALVSEALGEREG